MLFKKKNKKVRAIQGSVEDVRFYPIYHNDAISIVHDACIVCVAGEKERSLEEKIKFISDKIKLGHESILEHSNFICQFDLHQTENNYDALAEIQQGLKYLNVATKMYDNNIMSILIGGSARAFKYLIRTTYNFKNPLFISIIDYIKYAMPSCFFTDMIEDGIFKEIDFLNIYEDEYYKNSDYKNFTKSTTIDDGVILHIDNIYDIYDRLKGDFDVYELMDFCTINVLFHNVSRACSHQLVRHRNGITQLSQRYVDVRHIPMILPPFKDESIKEEITYILDDIIKSYIKLVDNCGVKREDARYIIPNACGTTLYMTFTFRNFLKAYDLRTGSGAQMEIHVLFDKLYSDVYKYWESQFNKKLTDHKFKPLDYIQPRYIYESIKAKNSLD